MVYLLETKLSERKSIFFSLIKIYGIGKANAFNLSKKLGFSPNLKVKDLSVSQIAHLIKLIETSNLVVNVELQKLQTFTLKKLISIKSYRGLRRLKGLPVRGQRTHTNAKTAQKRKKI